VRRLLLFFKIALHLLKEGGAWETLDERWSAADTNRLNVYLTTQEGKNFLHRLRAMSLIHNRAAVMESNPWKNGHAAGYMAALTDIQALSNFTAPESPEELNPEEDIQFGTDQSSFLGPMRQ
jgi:hypothetical protein